MRTAAQPCLLAMAAVLCTSAAAISRQATTASFIVIPGRQFGPIRETTTHNDLRTLFPGAAIRDEPIDIGEGICTDGTRIYAGTPDELDLAWQDADRSRVAFVRSSSPGGRWATTRGLRVGSTLRELEDLAGRVLSFAGFGWDYGGGLEWQEGPDSLRVFLTIDPPEQQAGADGAIFGDRLVQSDYPAIRQLRIVVDSMTLSWGNHFGEHDCSWRQ
jgi:hypothetical protein